MKFLSRYVIAITILFVTFSLQINAQNMISNGDFESSFSDWSNIVGGTASATFTVETSQIQSGTKAMKVVVSTAGANAYDIQSIHAGWACISGTSYTLTLWAKAATNGAQIKLVQQNNNYSEKIITLTTTYTQYTWTFTASENGTKFRVNFPQAGTFYIDNVNITDPNPVIPPANTIVTITPTTTFQTMVGFGGAMTWYSDWIMAANQTTKDQLYQLLFNDLGIDIVRLKNWYFPVNYPTNKAITGMASIGSYNATLEFYNKAKTINPNIDILMCSWTPPTNLKSNNNLNEGTLKKNASNKFMYGEFAQYWIDVLNTYETGGMKPDYISIQNEPGYQNAGWETCEWRPTETTDYPSYGIAFDSVYNRVKLRTSVPKMIGPEVENIGNDSDIGTNTYTGYTDPIKTKTGLYAYAYHLYNFSGANESTIMSSATSTALNVVKNYSDKPNFMTEFGSLDWYNTALMINQNLTQSNVSAYIHWELVWQDNNETAVALTNAGAYTIKPPYYTLKHYAKNIDKGYQRIQIVSDNSNVAISAFKNPAANQITLVAINRATAQTSTTFNLGTLQISGIQAFQSVVNNYYQTLTGLTATSAVVLPAQSITTIVINYIDPNANILPVVAITSPSNNTVYAAGSTVPLTATATDADGTISKVEFYNGATLLGTDATSPYAFSWTNVVAGTYTITAKATDNKTGVTTSTAITIVVNPKQTIALQVGWNLISLNVSPTDKTIETVFGSVLTNVLEVKNADGFWRYGQNVALNSLNSISDGQAYLVKMQTAGTITVTGTPVLQVKNSYVFRPGWNMVGCSYQTSTAISPVISTKPISIIKNFDGFWQSTGSPSITTFEPGKGYYFNAGSVTTINW